jgi:hypothetical protein
VNRKRVQRLWHEELPARSDKNGAVSLASTIASIADTCTRSCAPWPYHGSRMSDMSAARAPPTIRSASMPPPPSASFMLCLSRAPSAKKNAAHAPTLSAARSAQRVTRAEPAARS